MKKSALFMFFAFLCLGNISFPQEELKAGELIIDFVNLPGSWSVTLKLEAIGTVWDHYHEITNEYEGGEKSYSQNSPDYFHASDLSWSYCGFDPVLSLGIYQISVWEGNNKRAWFFIDYRTSQLPNTTFLGCIDVVLDFDVINKSFAFTNPNIGSVANGSYYPIWELKDSIQLQTNDLDNYWDNCLAVFPNGNNHPRLAWGTYSDNIDISGYRIYRKYGSSQWELLSTLGADSYTYLDETVSITPPGGSSGSIVYYYVKGIYIENPPNYIETSATNTVSVNVPTPEIEKGFYGQNHLINKKFGLNQNFPNPFNPTTRISWTSDISDFVTIKVFDTLGKEIAVILNEYRNAGNYSIEFNGSNFNSGIYFYRIQNGPYSETRKLILAK